MTEDREASRSGEHARPTHCKFNNMPCMRGCQGTACSLYADWSKAMGPRDRAILDTQQAMRMASAAAGMTWWEPPPPPPRYDGSLDDWDVDEWKPSEAQKLQQIRDLLAANGISLSIVLDGNGRAEIHFRVGNESINAELDTWYGETRL